MDLIDDGVQFLDMRVFEIIGSDWRGYSRFSIRQDGFASTKKVDIDENVIILICSLDLTLGFFRCVPARPHESSSFHHV